MIGWLGRLHAPWERGLAPQAAALVASTPMSDVPGFALAGLFAALLW